jgi:hypothetical protein
MLRVGICSQAWTIPTRKSKPSKKFHANHSAEHPSSGISMAGGIIEHHHQLDSSTPPASLKCLGNSNCVMKRYGIVQVLMCRCICSPSALPRKSQVQLLPPDAPKLRHDQGPRFLTFQSSRIRKRYSIASKGLIAESLTFGHLSKVTPGETLINFLHSCGP